MPKERVTSTTRFRKDQAPGPDNPPGTVANTETFDLAVGWNKRGRWVQVNVIPHGWQDTGDWVSFDMDEDQIDHLIRALRRAKRQTWGLEVTPGIVDYGDTPGGLTADDVSRAVRSQMEDLRRGTP
ncbi:hypothetical protein [Cellulosimicrobium funkei]|uniref:hypothetical protein n=1 Tax=Cellulosimicrobium funkei TaxID=264251 RepID=UPI003434EBA3